MPLKQQNRIMEYTTYIIIPKIVNLECNFGGIYVDFTKYAT